MKVIKKPPEENWLHRFTCKQCLATLEAEKGDIHTDSMDWREPTWYYVICPFCKTKEAVTPPRLG